MPGGGLGVCGPGPFPPEGVSGPNLPPDRRNPPASLLGSSPDALDLTVAGLRAAAGKQQQAPPENGATPAENGAAPAAAAHYTYHTTNFTEGWVGTLQDDHVQLTKGDLQVPAHSDDARAWASQRPNGGEEWLEVTFARAVFATGVRVVQSQFPGAIVRIDATLADGNAVTVWSGPDKAVYEAGMIGVLEGTFAATKTPVARLKIVLDTRLVSGWNEIDAVQLVGDPGKR